MHNDVTPERTNWRDQEISLRHRQWGCDLSLTDIDFLGLEYHKRYNLIKPAAIVEYKKLQPPEKLPYSMQYKALATLCSTANIPFFVNYYEETFNRFVVFAGNAWAKKYFNGLLRQTMSEEDYVKLLYKVRGLQSVPKDVLEEIRATHATLDKIEQLSLF